MSIATNAHLPTLLFAAFAAIAMTGCAVSLDLDNDTTRRIENDTVRVADLRSLDVTTENGRIQLQFETAPTDVDAKTDNGAIAIRLPAGDEKYDVDAASANGSIDVGVRADPAAERHITARSNNGAIDIEYRATS